MPQQLRLHEKIITTWLNNSLDQKHESATKMKWLLERYPPCPPPPNTKTSTKHETVRQSWKVWGVILIDDAAPTRHVFGISSPTPWGGDNCFFLLRCCKLLLQKAAVAIDGVNSEQQSPRKRACQLIGLGDDYEYWSWLWLCIFNRFWIYCRWR